MIDYATGREMPADKLTVREVHDFKADAPKRGALRIAKLKHAGDWNIAPQAIPNLMDALRKPPFSFDVVITQKDLFPRDPNLIYYPLDLHPRPRRARRSPRRTSTPCAGTSSRAAARSSPTPPAAARPSTPSFRRFVAELLPNHPLVPIPRDDELYTNKVGFDLSDVQYTKAAGGGRDFPAARGSQDQRPLGDHLLEVRHRLRPGAAHRHRLQGLHATRAP